MSLGGCRWSSWRRKTRSTREPVRANRLRRVAMVVRRMGHAPLPRVERPRMESARHSARPIHVPDAFRALVRALGRPDLRAPRDRPVNVPLIVATACASILLLMLIRRILARIGYECQVAIVLKTPTPRMPRPKAGNIVIPLQLTRAFYGILQEGAVGIIRLESVGDGTQTLVVEQQAPQTP